MELKKAFFSMYKMFKINVKTYETNYIHTTTIHKKDNKSILW